MPEYIVDDIYIVFLYIKVLGGDFVTITQQQYDALAKKLEQLEAKFDEWQTDYEKLKEYHLRNVQSTNDLFEKLVIQKIIPKLDKHSEDILLGMKGALEDRRHLTATMERLQEVRRAIFPERYIEGADPVLTIRNPPEKKV